MPSARRSCQTLGRSCNVRRMNSRPLVQILAWQALSLPEQAAVRALKVPHHQIEFAGTVEAAVAQCEAAATEDLIGLAILAEQVVVGFLVLKRGTKAPVWAPEGAAVVSAMRIDVEHQGRGFGTAALKQLPAWVASQWAHARSIVLSVDEENTAGIRSYRSAGWVDNGVRVQGRIGWVRHMSLQIAQQ